MKTKIYNKTELKKRRQNLRNNTTHAEVILWNHLRNESAGVKFRRQYSILSYIVDFFSPEIKLAIEVDGETHLTEKEIEHDAKRQRDIEKLNVKFLRFGNEYVYGDLESVLKEIKDKVTELKTMKPPLTPP